MQDDAFSFGKELRQRNETLFTAYRSVHRRNVKKGKAEPSARRIFSTKNNSTAEHRVNIDGVWWINAHLFSYFQPPSP